MRRLLITMIMGIGWICGRLELASAQIRVSSDLDCNFSSHCRWMNGSLAGAMLPESVGWGLMSDSQSDDRFPLSDGKGENTFTFTAAPHGGRYELWLVSDVIGCQLGGARLKFWSYFTGKNAKLDVCTRFPPGSMDPLKLRCYDSSSNSRPQQWTLSSITLPPMSQSMEIVLRAIFQAPGDLVAIDDITYEAILCETVSSGAAQGAGGQIDPAVGDETYRIEQIMSSSTDEGQKPVGNSNNHFLRPLSTPLLMEFASNLRSAPLPRTPFAALKSVKSDPYEYVTSNCGLDCNFDTNHMCNYESINKDGTMHRSWTLTSRPVSNPLTGIQHDSKGKGGSFVYAGSTHVVEHIYVLKSKKGMMSLLKGNNTLQFDYYLAGVRGRLLVCLLNASHSSDGEEEDSLLKLFTNNKEGRNEKNEFCPFQQNGVNMHTDSRQWKTTSISIPDDVKQIFFIADRLPKNYIIGLDEVKLMDKYGRVPANCVGSPVTNLLASSSPPTSINVEDYFQ